jgi:hypothetical protein
VIQDVWHLLVALGALYLAWTVRREAHGLYAACMVVVAVGALVKLATDL